ncbi:membrane attack complex component/perforin (macpf) domain [Holotrichia oblita]|uniref:Membrane attack complex component/perforin (Macpf) domain n=2 Tax=Holotrichia oblita TaxID=644536 RepID=A0ACB9TAT8_HOLOL|nr:membrane attack complex component/perforin (macpf) domain [Holotrichia oblita]KAI4463927.1 membrane attack complex component/perforin (macpf) domain [Holotrichia oblita]
MWSRAVLLVLVTTTVYYADAEDNNSQDLDAQLRVGHSINLFTRYGYLSISMKVVERNETNTDWIFREPTVDIFADVTPLTEHPTRNAKKVIFDGDFHMEFCDNLMQLLQAYFRNYSFEKLDRPWRAFSGSWQADNIARNMGINSSFVHGDYCYVLLRLSRTRDTVKLGPIPSNVNLSDVVAREIDNIKVGDIDSVWTFIKKYGSHYINSYVTGNSLYQVYVYKKSTYDEIKHRLRSVGISNMSPAELGTYFGPWHAQHIGKIKVASGNKTVESWAAKNLRVQYYFFTYPSLLKIHDSVNLMTILNDILKNEALVELEMRALTPAFKDPAKRKWFEEVLTNFLHLYETNL